MKKAKVLLVVLFIAMVWASVAFSLVMLGEGSPGKPVHRGRGWPEGLAEVLTRGGRVYSSNVVGGYAGLDRFETSCFYFSGDADDFNWFVKQYAELKGVSRTLGLRGGPAKATGIIDKQKVIPYDWMVRISSTGHLGIGLELAVGGNVDLNKVRVPSGMKVQAGEGIEAPRSIHETEGEQAPKGRTSGSPPLISRRALYGKMAVTADATKILSIVLDESKGTRTGYDVLWADVDFDGTFEESEKLTPLEVKRHGSWLSTASFAPLNFDVPYKGKARGISNPCQIVLGYRQYPRAGVAEDFSVMMKIKLRQETTVWDYSVGGSVKPSKQLKDAVVWTLPAPRMELSTQPDGRNKGHLGIALDVSAGEGGFECKKAGVPIKADVEVKSQNGTVMHRGDATLDKFVFG